MKKIDTRIGFLILAVILLAFGIAIFFNWPKEEKPLEITISKKEIPEIPEIPADWKTYRNEKYGFEFRYPSDWKEPEPNVCDGYKKTPFCLGITSYDEIPSAEDVEVCFETTPDLCTKEEFNSYKNALANGVLPPGLTHNNGWRIIKVGGRNAMQLIYYHIYSAQFLIETRLFTDILRIELVSPLPIDPFYTYTPVYGGYQYIPDIPKNQKMEKELNKGIFPNKEAEKRAFQYNKIISSFKFIE